MKTISIKTCTIIAALCFTVPAMAQKNFGSAKYTAMCSYYGETISGDIEAYEAGRTAGNVVKDIMSVIGLKSNFELRAANVPNAAAVILKSKRYILYNPDFMDKINSATGNKWAAISILAHEIGHHLNGHTLDKVGSRPQTELEADEFSGFVLRKMGASLVEAQSAMAMIASLKGSHTHPAKNDRLAYIATGWKSAGAGTSAATIAANAIPASGSAQPFVPKKPIAPTRSATIQKPAASRKPITMNTPAAAQRTAASNAAAKPQSSRREKINESMSSGSNVASDAHFDANPQGKYFLTTKGNLVQVANDKVYLIASLEKSDRPGYKLMLDDKASPDNIYIGSGGTLISAKGRKIGHLASR
ncbi:hypothetical protein [uncultured Flavobacterium sp.]|uniref:hypothetical protein n=1 Tax=uncultured Flavobacterium sp. TaxID=165435 RepID=UPI0025D4943A|nr:hypothetical protein [uncultured Flavobacterium sp.]